MKKIFLKNITFVFFRIHNNMEEIKASAYTNKVIPLSL